MNRAPFKLDKSLTQFARIEGMLHITYIGHSNIHHTDISVF